MVALVHIADERDAASIERGGLKLPRRPAVANRPLGVFALPVVPNFAVSHQWVRELKRRGFRTAVGVYFRLPDAEPVWVGLYNEEKVLVTAAEAARRLMEQGELGLEVIVPRSIKAGEIRSVRALPQALGWRYFPGAHQAGVFCGCKYCQRGSIKSRKLVEAYG